MQRLYIQENIPLTVPLSKEHGSVIVVKQCLNQLMSFRVISEFVGLY
jgi:hypothetical protein